MPLSPLAVQILIHYATRVDDYDRGVGSHFCSEAVQDLLQEFVEAGLLTETEAPAAVKYRGNLDALRVYVHAICAVPLPVKSWVMPT